MYPIGIENRKQIVIIPKYTIGKAPTVFSHKFPYSQQKILDEMQ